MNKVKDFLMIGSYVCGLNSEFFRHNDKNLFFLLETNKYRKACIFYFESVHVVFLHGYRNELSL